MTVTLRIGTLSVEGPVDAAALRRQVERALAQRLADTAPRGPDTAALPARPGEPGFATALAAHVARRVGR
ncbi:hypothetical protein ACQW02_05080 [Humitalea sp. 24SJ18S-53]|uniref:hypothetical protein n=1 Tax=Humitalea sp. 24SJ18S-53 TaxID=3422307 RepID=UPI003D66D7B3